MRKRKGGNVLATISRHGKVPSDQIDEINWDDIKIFAHTARAGNFREASRRLKINHSTVSRRIAQLEIALGASVFERNSSGLQANRLGERLLRHADRIENAMMALQAEVVSTRSMKADVVRLAAMEGIVSLYLAQYNTALQNICPVTFVELVTPTQNIYVNRQEMDLFLGFDKPLGQGLVSYRLGGFNSKLYASPEYLETAGVPKSTIELQKHCMIVNPRGLTQENHMPWLDNLVAEAQASFESNNMIAKLHAAIAGLGIALLPEFAAKDNNLTHILPEVAYVSHEIWISFHNDLRNDLNIKSICNLLEQIFTEDPKMQVTLSK